MVYYTVPLKKKKERKKEKEKKKENMAVTPSFHESSTSYSSKKRGWHALAV